jgi:hypothetical protein
MDTRQNELDVDNNCVIDNNNSVADNKTNKTFDDLLEAEKKLRKDQEEFWCENSYDGDYTNYKKPDEERLKIYTKIISDEEKLSGSRLKMKMETILYHGDNKSKFTECPYNYLDGPFMNSDDIYEYIFGMETNKKLKGLMNPELFERINGTEITYGMLKSAQGCNWYNGVIAYNGHSIVIRDKDNAYGQPGFLSILQFYDRLGIEILKRYLVVELKNNVQRGEISVNSNPYELQEKILSQYTKVRTDKINMLYIPDITIEHLFSDAPICITNKMDEKDIRIEELSKTINILKSDVETLLCKMKCLEEMILDMSISHNKN